jgi:hypothetical protein
MFLETLGLIEDGILSIEAALAAVILQTILASMAVFFLVIVGLYVYTSFAFMAIAKKAKYKTPEIAWVPVVGPLLIQAKTAKMHWWPILLLLGAWIPFLGWALGIVVSVFSIIWMWKTLEAIHKPGWWVLISAIPVIGIAWFVLLGIAAWSKK